MTAPTIGPGRVPAFGTWACAMVADRLQRRIPKASIQVCAEAAIQFMADRFRKTGDDLNDWLGAAPVAKHIDAVMKAVQDLQSGRRPPPSALTSWPNFEDDVEDAVDGAVDWLRRPPPGASTRCWVCYRQPKEMAMRGDNGKGVLGLCRPCYRRIDSLGGTELRDVVSLIEDACTHPAT